MKSAILSLALLASCTSLFACGAADTGPARSAPADTAAATPGQSTPAAQPANAPATPEAPAPAIKPASDSPDTGDYGKYYGSCKKDSTKHCSDGYCKGAQCDQFMGGAKKNCDGVYSQDKCPAGSATAICLLPTDIGGNIVNSVNFYYDGENHEPSCKAFGAKMLKK